MSGEVFQLYKEAVSQELEFVTVELMESFSCTLRRETGNVLFYPQAPPSRLADPLLAADLVGMAAPIAKWCFEPNSLDDLPLILRRAFYNSMSPPRGPVFLSLPMNILDESGSPPMLPASRVERASVGSGVPDLAQELLQFRPGRTVIVAGNDIAETGVDDSIASVARLLGAPVYGSSWPSVNNFASIDPFWRGSLPTTARGISEILGRYDCMLGLGGKTLVAIVYTARDPIPEDITFYHISEDGNDLCHNDAPKLGIVGNVKATLEVLAEELGRQVSLETVERNVRIAREAKAVQESALRQQAEIADQDPDIRPIIAARQLMRVVADGTLVVDEAPCANAFTQRMHRSTAAKQYFHNRGGTLGWGMPAAVGVSLAHDKAPVLCVVGDGSALYSPQALWSAVHEETPVVFVVLNNAEYGILKEFMLNQPQYNAQKHGFLAMDICDPPVDFQFLARSMGVNGAKGDIERSDQRHGRSSFGLRRTPVDRDSRHQDGIVDRGLDGADLDSAVPSQCSTVSSLCSSLSTHRQNAKWGQLKW